MFDRRLRLPLVSAVLILLVAAVVPAGAQQAAPGDKTSGELWLDAHRDAQEKRYVGEPIDLSLRDADLVETLRSFAELGRFNLIVQSGVEGKVTVELKQVPWDLALEQILKINNLSMEISGGRSCPKARAKAGAGPDGPDRRCVTVSSRLAP